MTATSKRARLMRAYHFTLRCWNSSWQSG